MRSGAVGSLCCCSLDEGGRQGGTMETRASRPLLHSLCPHCIQTVSLLQPHHWGHSSQNLTVPRQAGQCLSEPAKPISLHKLRDKPKNNLVIFYLIQINISPSYK